MEKLLSLSEAAEVLGVTTQTLRNWDRADKIKTVRTVGSHRRIPVSEIERLQQTKEENHD
jgi:putative resolvase